MLVCIYCGEEKPDWRLSCCGENHYEDSSERDERDAETSQPIDAALRGAFLLFYKTLDKR